MKSLKFIFVLIIAILIVACNKEIDKPIQENTDITTPFVVHTTTNSTDTSTKETDKDKEYTYSLDGETKIKYGNSISYSSPKEVNYL